MRRRTFMTGLAGLATTAGLTACGTGTSGPGAEQPSGPVSDEGSGTIKVAYQKFGNYIQGDKLFTKVKEQFEAENSSYKVELIPIEASQNDYFTKLALMNRSESTAPDIMYEDTYMIRSDVDAGYLRPLDDHLGGWSEWGQFVETAKQAGLADDGKTYGIPMGTDTRGLWFHKELITKAGLPEDWAPANWDELLEAARAIKKSSPDVIPFNIYSGKPMGEAAVMQGFEMLLYGTGGTLYDTANSKWIVGAPQFVSSLNFLKTVFSEGLAPQPQQALDANWSTKVQGELLPKGKLAIALDGSWLPGTWQEDGEAPWKEWSDQVGTAAMPTETGQEPGKVSMSGGWTIAMGAHCKNPNAAFTFMSMALGKDNALDYNVGGAEIAVRTDVAADEKYLSANPTTKFWSDLVEVTHYRPATADYPQISNEIMVAMESVMTGKAEPADAAKKYDDAVVSLVGKEQTAAG
ncbi:extracellular solute-binding protein [Propionibacteriaceae bacterium Y1685]